MSRKEYIQKELEELQSSLAKAPTVEVFTVPNGYFEGLGASIQQQLRSSLPASSSNVFSVPEGYFDHLPQAILNKINEPTPVVVMNRSRAFVRYAFAACMAGLIGWGALWISQRSNITADEELAAALQEAHSILANNNFDSEMKTLSDDDIVQYLHLNGSDVNAALVASLADDGNIPSEDEYLYNEQTLDRVLQKVNVKMNSSY
jgi:hypothetical protein